jgi:hypothetical protein
LEHAPESPLIDAPLEVTPPGVRSRLERARLRALPWGGEKISQDPPRSSLHAGHALAPHSRKGAVINLQAQALVAAVVGPSLASAERRGRGAGRGNLSSLDGFGRAASTTAADPGVVLRVANGIVRIVVHVVAGEDLGGRLRRGLIA